MDPSRAHHSPQVPPARPVPPPVPRRALRGHVPTPLPSPPGWGQRGVTYVPSLVGRITFPRPLSRASAGRRGLTVACKPPGTPALAHPRCRCSATCAFHTAVFGDAAPMPAVSVVASVSNYSSRACAYSIAWPITTWLRGMSLQGGRRNTATLCIREAPRNHSTAGRACVPGACIPPVRGPCGSAWGQPAEHGGY
jgi:hypothetical protein